MTEVQEKRCLMCNKPLNTDISIKRQFGPTCFKKLRPKSIQLSLLDLIKEMEDGQLQTTN
jgi:hypothetical protein